MAYEGYQFLKIRVDRGVAFVTIDNPPINLLTLELGAELVRLGGEILADDTVKVTVFDSANPDFFIAHFDVNVLVMLGGQPLPPSPELNDLVKATEIFRRMPKVSIAKIEGRARGGEASSCSASICGSERSAKLFSPSRKSAWASSPAGGAPNVFRGSWARLGLSKSSWVAAISTPRQRNDTGTSTARFPLKK